jgi:hypothetical protein
MPPPDERAEADFPQAPQMDLPSMRQGAVPGTEEVIVPGTVFRLISQQHLE